MLKNHRLILTFLLLVTFFFRVIRLGVPADYVFDEVYHVVAVKAIAHNNFDAYNPFAQSPEPNTAYDWLHPPLAKLIQATSVKILGENSFAWRLPSAIFGTLSIYALYLLSLTLTQNPSLSLITATIFSLDNLQLTMSRITMNDIFVTTWIILALNFFYRSLKAQGRTLKGSLFQVNGYAEGKVQPYWFSRHLFLTGLFTGLSIATKHSGALLYLIYFIYLFPDIIKGSLLRNFKSGLYWKKIFSYFVFLVILPLTIYLLSYSQAFILGMTLKDFFALHQQIYWYQTSLTATHSYQSSAWQWPLLIRPVWFFVSYAKEQVANIYNLGNPAIFWGGLLSIFIASLRPLKPAIKFVLIAYLALFSPFVFSPRIMFLHHYLPALPFLSLILAYTIYPHKKLIPSFLCLFFLIFIFFYPLNTAILLPNKLLKYWFWLPSWK